MSTNWADLKVTELKAELKKRGYPVGGVKAELIARLEADDAASKGGKGEDLSAADVDSEGVQDEISAGTNNKEALHTGTTETELTTTSADNSIIETPSNSVLDNGASAVDDTQAVEPATEVVIEQEDHMQLDEISSSSNIKAPETGEVVSTPVAEVLVDLNSRKRRSRSPAPSAINTPRKRLRADEDLPYTSVDGQSADVDMQASETPQDVPQAHQESPSQTKDARFKGLFDPTTEQGPNDYKLKDNPIGDELERTVDPAMHAATSALYIRDFQRPLNEATLKAHLVDLATAPGSSPSANNIITFFLDAIRTHSFVEFTTTAAASRVRAEMHGRVWPPESNRTALWADFIPPEKARAWRDQEVAGTRYMKWEVSYEPDEDGIITASLQEANSVPAARRASAMGPPRALIPPTGPRHPDAVPFSRAPPSGPRSMNIESRGRGGSGVSGAQAPSADTFSRGAPRSAGLKLDPRIRSTEAGPSLHWQPVSKELANNRLDNIDRITTKRSYDKSSDLHRYSFDHGDVLIDRGEERFPGIRPPPPGEGERLGRYRGAHGDSWGGSRGDRGGRGFHGRGGGGGFRGRGGGDSYRGAGLHSDGRVNNSGRLSREDDYDRRGGYEDSYRRGGSGRSYDRPPGRDDYRDRR